MIRSMTGFGGASEDAHGVRYAVEVRTVNSKYFKAVVRTPEGFEDLEPEVESIVRSGVQRGTITVTISASQTQAAETFEISKEAIDRYVQQIRAVEFPPNVSPTLDVASLLALPGVLVTPADLSERHERARGAVLSLVRKAVAALLAMRDTEGRSVQAELSSQLALVRDRLSGIEQLAPGVVEQYADRLKTRIVTMLTEAGAPPEMPDVIREVAAYAERTDIHEEITRLRAHLDQFDELLVGEEAKPVGRTLDFLSQELLREANTIASKTPDAQVSRLIIEIKGAIDRVKELVQNAE